MFWIFNLVNPFGIFFFFFFKLMMYLNINEVPRPNSSGFKIPIPMTVYRIIKKLMKYFFDNLVICKDIMMFLES